MDLQVGVKIEMHYCMCIVDVLGTEPPEIRSLSLLLASVYNWENLGVKLGITMQKLQEIKQQYHDDLEMCKNRLYDMWLRQTTEPSWREIVDALEQIEENNLADKIRRRVFLQPSAESELCASIS